MPGYALRFRLLPLGAVLCVGACLTTEGYYRYQDSGTPGTAGESGTAGVNGMAGTTGAAGTGGGPSGTAGTTGVAGTGTARGGTAGTAGRGGTPGRGGTTGSAGSVGAGGGGMLLSETFDPMMMNMWDYGAAPSTTHMLVTDTGQGQVLSITEAMGKQLLATAGMLLWTNYSVEAKVKVTSFTGTSSSDGVGLGARLTGPESFYYYVIQASDTKGKVKINNGSNS